MSPPKLRFNPPLRVIHVITRLILGGAQENTLLTVEGLQCNPRFRVTLVSGPAIGPEGELVRRAREHHIDLRILPQMRRELNPARDLTVFFQLAALFRRERPHIVHTHSSKAGILGRLAARATGVPIIIHTIHGLPFHPYQAAWLNHLFVNLERLAARWTTAFISVANAMTDQAVAVGIAPRERFTTIYSGIEAELFLAPNGNRSHIRARFGIGLNDLVIGKVARLFDLKGHADVLQAAPAVLARFPQTRFLFVGDGILRQKLEAEARRLGIADRVIFAGLIQPSEMPAMIKAMDVLVHASLREGLARVLPQALLSGCPVISYDVDGAREVVVDGVTGFLVPPRSVEGLSAAMIRTLSDLTAARRMAEEGRRRCRNHFPAEVMVGRIEALYDSLIAAHRAKERPASNSASGI